VLITKYFKGVARLTKTFAIQVGPIQARGVPAVLVAATGLVTAATFARGMMHLMERLPETLREARVLAQELHSLDRQPQLRP